MDATATSLRPAWLAAAAAIARGHFERVEPNLAPIGIVGVIGFPLYWLVWAQLFPQPYESLTLRLVGAALCLPMALKRLWPKSRQGALRLWWYGMLLYSLPFFFTYLSIRNEFSFVWQMSTLAATFLMVLLLDWITLLLLFSLGTALAWGAAALTVGHLPLPDRYFESLPIFLFALIAGTIFNYKAELLRQERRRAALAFGSNIADEIRSPLSGIKTAAAGLRQMLPLLLRSAEGARERTPADVQAVSGLEHVVDRVWRETEHLTAILDIMLISAGDPAIDRSRFRRVSMLDCVHTALARYPFASAKDAARISVRATADFAFDGSEQLAQFVILTLIRNGLYAVSRAGRGMVTLTLEAVNGGNSLVVRDDGPGLSPHELARVFDGDCPSIEPGIATTGGLAYCRSVAAAFGGSLSCRSRLGEFTEFEWRLPAAGSAPVPAAA